MKKALDPLAILSKPADIRSLPPNLKTYNGQELGIPRLGRVVPTEPNFIPDLLRARAALQKVLRHGETYLDLTYQQALYYYFDLPCPVAYSAFVAANSRMQARIMRQLQRDPVPVVMIGPPAWIDETPASMRCYQLYHDYVLRYPLVAFDEWVFLVDPARAPGVGPVGSEDQLQILDRIFAKRDLHRLPIAWGRSWATLRPRFKHIATLAPSDMSFTHDIEITPSGSFASTGADPYIMFPMPQEVPGSDSADFVRFHFEFEPVDPAASNAAAQALPTTGPGSAEPHLALYWITHDDRYSEPIQFKGANGELLVPLGVYPRWLLGKGMKGLRFDLDNPGCARRFRISDIEFLRHIPG